LRVPSLGNPVHACLDLSQKNTESKPEKQQGTNQYGLALEEKREGEKEEEREEGRKRKIGC